jgi:L-threonylcarbamoyladenylate synthase
VRFQLLRSRHKLSDTRTVKTSLTRSVYVAAAFIRRGGIVAFPTETVYGLGADAFNEEAIRKVFTAKNRPADNPLIAHIGAIDQIVLLTDRVPESAEKLIEAFFPGPLTIVVPRAPSVPLIATAGLETIGVRMPANQLAQNFLRECAVPVVAPSANLSGRPSPTTWEAVHEDLDERIDCILQGEPTTIGLESTVVDCTTDLPLILRRGAVSLESLRKIVPEMADAGSKDLDVAKSPGLKHRHYSPNARVEIVDDVATLALTSADAYIGLNLPAGSSSQIKICNSIDEYAASLFEFFRECDRAAIQRIFCERIDETGIGAALMDRIRRAAES